MLDPFLLYKSLKESPVFENKGFLSHFFFPITKDLVIQGTPEIGIFNPDNQKITVYINVEHWQKKPEDNVFKRPNDKVQELKLDGLKSFSEILVVVRKEISDNHKNGFCILQCFNGVATWNFSFLTVSVELFNIRVNAKTGEVISKDTVTLVQK